MGSTSFTYDGKEKPVSVSAEYPDGRRFSAFTVRYTGSGATTYPESTTAPVAAGSYDISVTLNDAANYAFADPSSVSGKKLTVSKAEILFTVGDTRFIFDNSAKPVTITAEYSTGGRFTGFTVEYTGINGTSYAKSTTAPSAVGTYSITVTLTDTANYRISAESAPITGRTMTIINGQQKPISFRDGLVNKLVTDGKFTNPLTNENVGATTTYTSGNPSVATVDAAGEVTILAAGSTTVTAKSALADTTDVYASYTLNVTKKEITVTVKNRSIAYGEASPYDALDDLTFSPAITVTDTPNFITSYTAGKGVNDYSVRVTLPVSDIYAYVYEPGTLTVNPKVLKTEDFEVHAEDKVYDGTDSAKLTATVKAAALIGSDTLKASAEGSFVDTAAGTGKTVNYTVTELSGVKAGNYVLDASVSGTTTADITKEQITFRMGGTTFASDGTPKPVSVTAEYPDGRAFDAFIVKYKGTDGTPYGESEAAPSAVGSYDILITLNDTTNYEIANPAAVIGRKLSIVRMSVIFTVGTTSFAYDGNKKPVTITAVDEYGASFTEFTVKYKGINGTSYSESASAPSEVGDYAILITMYDPDKYAVANPEAITNRTLTIGKFPVIFSFGASEFSYDGSRKSVPVSATDSDNRVFTAYTVFYEGTGTTDYIRSTTAPSEVGTYTVTAEYDANSYRAEKNSTTMTITAGSVAVWASGGTAHLYNDADKTVTVMSVPLLELDVTYYEVKEDGTVGDVTVPSGLGRYLYVITLKNNELNRNYAISGALQGDPDGYADELVGSNIGVMTIENSIQPALSVDQIMVTKEYGDGSFTQSVTGGAPDAEITYSIPNPAEREFATVDAQTGEITILKPGTAVVEVRASRTGYTDTTTRFAVCIEKRLVDITLGSSVRYTGQTQTVPYTVTNDISGNRVRTEDIRFFCQNLSQTQSSGLFRNAGTYYVTGEIPSGNEYYRTNGASSKNIEILKAPLTVTADDKTVTYGSAAPAFTVSYTPLGEDAAGCLDGSAEYACAYSKYSGVGDYTVAVSGLSSDNYDITFEDGTLTAEPLPVSLSWSAAAFTYDGTEHILSAQVTNAVNDDDVRVTAYVGYRASDAGSYLAKAVLLNNENYTLTDGTAVSRAWTIDRRAATVRPEDVKVAVNGTAALKLDVSALLEADRSYSGTPLFRITNAEGREVSLNEALSSAGTYTVTWTNPGSIAFSPNYTVTRLQTATLTVQKSGGGSGGGGGTGGGGGGGSSSTAGENTVTIRGNGGSIESAAALSGRTAEVRTVTEDALAMLCGGGTVEFDLTDFGQSIDEVRLPAEALEKIAEKGGIRIRFSVAELVFDQTAVKEMVRQTNSGAIRFCVSSVSEAALNDAQKKAVETLDAKKIFEIHLASDNVKLCTESKGGFAGGKAELVLMFRLEEGSTAGNYSVYYVSEAGGLTRMNAKYDAGQGAFVFAAGHCSSYVIAYTENAYLNCTKDAACPIDRYVDTANGDWWHDGIHYCLSSGLMNGVSGTRFDPNGTITRGMIVTMLWRLDGQQRPSYGLSFKDVSADQWYTEAIRWAQAGRIVSGYNTEYFGPDDPVTREQLATILYHYAQYKGKGFKGPWTFLLDLTDRGKISVWADEAVHWCSENGIVTGKKGKVFDPQGRATRAEAAVMMQRFSEALKKQ